VSNLSFDTFAGGGRKQNPVSASITATGWLSNGVSFDDYGRMSTQKRKTSGERRLPTPLWSMSDYALRRVIVTFMEERALSKKERALRAQADKEARAELKLKLDKQKANLKVRRKAYSKQEELTLLVRLDAVKAKVAAKRPAALATMDELCAEYVEIKQRGLKPDMTDAEWNAARTEPYMEFAEGEARYQDEKQRLRQLERVIEGIDTYLRYTNNGGADMVVAAVYLYYRVGMDSVGVASELGLKSPHIRQILYRLHQTAKRVYPPNGIPSHIKDIVSTTKTKKEAEVSGTKKLVTPSLF
jgi:hypothetical protein